MAVPCCGPKLSVCCGVISLWGVVMLGLLGVFFYMRAPALIEDLPIDEKEWEEKEFSYVYIDELYQQNAINCWIAAGLYGATIILCIVMYKLNQRSTAYQLAH